MTVLFSRSVVIGMITKNDQIFQICHWKEISVFKRQPFRICCGSEPTNIWCTFVAYTSEDIVIWPSQISTCCYLYESEGKVCVGGSHWCSMEFFAPIIYHGGKLTCILGWLCCIRFSYNEKRNMVCLSKICGSDLIFKDFIGYRLMKFIIIVHWLT